MKKNRLLIAAAGAGKTTFLVKEALEKKEPVLITTYTEANELEIKRKIITINKAIPSNITIQTWFSFLIQHGVKPYQGSTFSKSIKGLHFTNCQSGFKYKNIITGAPVYYAEKDFEQHYFDKATRIYSDKLSKLVIRCNENSSGNVIDRISRLYPYIYIDEVQDLAGYDLDFLQHLFQSKSVITLVGDPRQVTYLTHHDKKYGQYKDGKIEDFILNECKNLDCFVDKDTLKFSHRNNAEICNFSSQLYPNFPPSQPCSCAQCRSYKTDHAGIYLVRPQMVDAYIRNYQPTILRYRDAVAPDWNFGKSKGLSFDRVLLYPPDTFISYLKDGTLRKIVKGKEKEAFDIAKLYVAITRARYSVGIVWDYADRTNFIAGINLYKV